MSREEPRTSSEATQVVSGESGSPLSRRPPRQTSYGASPSQSRNQAIDHHSRRSRGSRQFDEVAHSTSPPIRAGWRRAASSATGPPIE
jgi:hypothetical protein